jgi:hypothetical protein
VNSEDEQCRSCNNITRPSKSIHKQAKSSACYKLQLNPTDITGAVDPHFNQECWLFCIMLVDELRDWHATFVSGRLTVNFTPATVAQQISDNSPRTRFEVLTGVRWRWCSALWRRVDSWVYTKVSEKHTVGIYPRVHTALKPRTSSISVPSINVHRNLTKHTMSRNTSSDDGMWQNSDHHHLIQTYSVAHPASYNGYHRLYPRRYSDMSVKLTA